MPYFQGLLGIAAILLLAWLCSENRRRISWPMLAGGLVLQVLMGLVLLRLPLVAEQASLLNRLVMQLEAATTAGTSFVFGYLGGGPLPFTPQGEGGTWILAFRGLMLIPVLSALCALLFHWGILPLLVRGFARVLRSALRIDGPLGLGVAANVFMGMVESPLLIRHYLKDMSRADLLALMTAGMATLAGTVLVLYASFLRDVLDNAPLHILTASLMNCPAAVLLARMVCPAEGVSTVNVRIKSVYSGSLDAISSGTQEGVQLFFNVAFILVVMTALVFLSNGVLGLLPDVQGAPLTLQRLLGWLFTPLAWLMGIPWEQSGVAGSLLGTKLFLTELVAYLDLSRLPADTFSPRCRVIVTYALCGFANMGSLGIMAVGLGSLAPERRADVLALAGKATLLGFLASCLSATVAGLIL